MINELNSDYKNKLLNRFDDSFKNIVDNLVEINVNIIILIMKFQMEHLFVID